ncbi:winged helix-turn-helix transcriptional regulator [Candidatus Woesearchaeota archaeon]|nr:winged helix-turn-helix transcriptional regulator [Candidatus Woesearchaeota archaeon]
MDFKQDSSPSELDVVWPKYGLRESPYSTSPVRLVGILPIQKVFCGRKEEVESLKKIIYSKNSSRNFIVGDFGVGKTTFGNFIRWELAVKKGENARYLTTNAEIKVQPDWGATEFLLSTLSAIYTSSIVFNWEGKGIKLKSTEKIKEYVSVSKQKTVQGTVWIIGGGYGETKSNPVQLSPEILESLLQEVCQELQEKGKQIIIPYDNLENADIETLGEFFRSIRDYLQMEGLHTLFLGPTETISSLESFGQVYSVFSRPIILKPLSEDSVLEILSKRCDVLKIDGGNYIKPYEDETVIKLYNKLNHNIRFTFKVLEDATLNSERRAPCQICMGDIVAVQEKEKQEVMSSLTETQLRIVTALLDVPKLSQKDLSTITSIGITNLTTPVRELTKRGLIVESGDKEDSYLKLFFDPKEIK